MNTPQSQIKLNLSLPLKHFVENKANKLGVTIASYIRHLIMKDISELRYPIYQASKDTETSYKKAKQDENAGNLISINNIDEYFENL